LRDFGGVIVPFVLASVIVNQRRRRCETSRDAR
jgi:hypothetical protein